MSDLYSLSLTADDFLKKGISVPKDIMMQIKKCIDGSENIAIAQIDTISGNVEYNAKKIINYIKYTENIGIETIIFPEYALSGLLINQASKKFPVITDENMKWLDGIAKVTGNINVILGFIGKDYNSNIAVIKNGKVIDITDKNKTIDIENKKYTLVLGNNFYDDIENSDLIINCSSVSVNSADMQNIHNKISNFSKKYNSKFVFVNQVGATDNCIYQGSSAVFDNGNIISRALSFEEQLLIVSENSNKIYPAIYSQYETERFSLNYADEELEYTYKAIILGIRDYFSKCGLSRAVLGLSGGLDSSVCAVLLTDALGKENVFGVSMPSHITTKESKSDAEQLANNLGINFAVAPIKPIFEITKNCFDELHSKVEHCWDKRFQKSYTLDNIQARTRATYLWGVCNEFAGCIPIATSDKSEAYMGYATINGDMSGGFAPIADVTKTKLFALARWLNKNRKDKNAIPESVILKKPGAELAIDENTGKPLTAEDALMPYEFLDEVIWCVEKNNLAYNDLLNNEFIYEKKHKISLEQKTEWLDKFFGRMSRALFKWTIMPPSVILGVNTINTSVYKQPITSASIDYKGKTQEQITKLLNSVKA